MCSAHSCTLSFDNDWGTHGKMLIRYYFSTEFKFSDLSHYMPLRQRNFDVNLFLYIIIQPPHSAQLTTKIFSRRNSTGNNSLIRYKWNETNRVGRTTDIIDVRIINNLHCHMSTVDGMNGIAAGWTNWKLIWHKYSIKCVYHSEGPSRSTWWPLAIPSFVHINASYWHNGSEHTKWK